MVTTLSRPSSGADLALRARVELERRRRGLARSDPFARYRYDAAAYIRDKLGWTPWDGTDEDPGQMQVIRAYELALRQQHERIAYQAGDLAEADLRHWRPNEPIKTRIHVEAGHSVGKTKLESGLVNHFYDCFAPSIVYTFAPSWKQIHDLLWKEIKTDRRGKGLPGRILDLRLERSDDHFVTGTATGNAGGTGTERIQGQHGKYLMFVLDEGEGVADFVYSAVNSMTAGGISIVLMLANPRTTTSTFHKQKALSTVRSFRISCLHHPNVLSGRELVPGAVLRDYVELMIEKHCAVVDAHDADTYTFAVPWRPGVIYRPDAEFLFRVLGIAPKNVSDNTLVPTGRYEAAVAREALDEFPAAARMGVDVARWGKDLGTLYLRHDGRARRLAQFARLDTFEYARRIKEEARRLAEAGVTSLHVRVDGGGGFGGGVIDQLVHDLELTELFPDFRVYEVHFNGTPRDGLSYGDLVTELYADAGESLFRLKVEDPPGELEADLCERTYAWKNRQGVAVRKLEPKDKFRERLGRSPDDGDGFVLAVASDLLFADRGDDTVVYDDRVDVSPF